MDESLMSNIVFKFDVEKATAAILYLKHKCSPKDEDAIIKLMFLADQAHLVKYLRPITGGVIYNTLRGPCSAEFLRLVFALRDDNRDPNLDELSPSDVEVLNDAALYSSLSNLELMQRILNLQMFSGKTYNITSKIPYEDMFAGDPLAQDSIDLIWDHQDTLSILDD